MVERGKTVGHACSVTIGLIARLITRPTEPSPSQRHLHCHYSVGSHKSQVVCKNHRRGFDSRALSQASSVNSSSRVQMTTAPASCDNPIPCHDIRITARVVLIRKFHRQFCELRLCQ